MSGAVVALALVAGIGVAWARQAGVFAASTPRSDPVPTRSGAGAPAPVPPPDRTPAGTLAEPPVTMAAEPPVTVAAEPPVPASDNTPLSTGPITPSTGTPRSAPTRPTRPAATWGTLLASLDGSRERAFATRDPQALAAVYTSVPLRRADQATLRRVVPPPCRLIGLRTSYEQVRVLSQSRRIVWLRATASLASGQLWCPGQVAIGTRARHGVPITVRLDLIEGTYQIGAQTIG